MAVHHPKGPKEESQLLEAMRRFGEAHRRNKGSIVITAGKDEIAGYIFAVAIWDSKENFAAARQDMAKALEGVDFTGLEDTQHHLYLGEPLVWV